MALQVKFAGKLEINFFILKTNFSVFYNLLNRFILDFFDGMTGMSNLKKDHG
jgi:hypothetical protein